MGIYFGKLFIVIKFVNQAHPSIIFFALFFYYASIFLNPVNSFEGNYFLSRTFFIGVKYDEQEKFSRWGCYILSFQVMLLLLFFQNYHFIVTSIKIQKTL
eukprot:TRINITY_DN842_c0_g1_i1.p3 TRINITY_DN842_c0_g1~~TRINITY_DN842_c0_g1_i1.p3  ORF type:complete len:100 (-),score=0.25 TRINITY_DN842_c0_g1_i1:215-514(-)